MILFPVTMTALESRKLRIYQYLVLMALHAATWDMAYERTWSLGTFPHNGGARTIACGALCPPPPTTVVVLVISRTPLLAAKTGAL